MDSPFTMATLDGRIGQFGVLGVPVICQKSLENMEKRRPMPGMLGRSRWPPCFILAGTWQYFYVNMALLNDHRTDRDGEELLDTRRLFKEKASFVMRAAAAVPVLRHHRDALCS